MTLQEILSRLHGVHGSGKQYTARCPAHDDHNASLSIGQGDDGKILLHCHAGCDVEKILSALGLKKADLFNKPDAAQDFGPVARSGTMQAASEEDTYIYRDGNNIPILRKVRVRKPDGGKSFYWQYLDSGQWKKGRNGQAAPLYRQSDLTGAHAVYLVEGEKDVKTLERNGLRAVSPPDGANSKWREEYTAELAGHNVVILQDNDDPGKAFAQMAAGELAGKAKSVKVIDLTEDWPELPEHGDISDVLALFPDGDPLGKLLKRVDGTSEWDAGNTSQVSDHPSLLQLIRPIADFEEQEAEWLIDGWIPAGQITLFASDGGVGKTTIVCEIAAALSSGKACMLDKPGTHREPQRVLILTTEDSISKKLKRKLHRLGADQQLVFAPDPAMDTGNRLRDLKFGTPALDELIRAQRPALCILDPVQGYVPPDINMGSRNAMRDCMAPLSRLGEEIGTAFVVVCHTNKRRGASGRERISDSSDLWDISRSVMMAGFTGDGEVRYISNEKNNYAERQETVLFQMDKKGMPQFVGYSQKRDADYVMESARFKAEAEPVNEKLIEALRAEANPFEPVKFSYDMFEEKHGALIWGGKQPKRALDSVKPTMEKLGYSLVVKPVKIDGKERRGFLLQMVDTEAEQDTIPCE